MLCDQQLRWFCRDDVWKEDINGKHDKDKQVTVSASNNRFESTLPSVTLQAGTVFSWHLCYNSLDEEVWPLLTGTFVYFLRCFLIIS